MACLAIIGGSGFSSFAALQVRECRQVVTPFGETSAPLVCGHLDGTELLFLPRHGVGHRLPPHRINYRANLWALRASGADRVVGLAAVGGIGDRFPPLTIVVPDDIIDYTYGRGHTIYDGEGERMEHVDMTSPYCEELRQALIRACAASGCVAVANGTYGATQGPRLETTAEIARQERDGCDLVGMTGMPEAAIARELGLCYASLAFVVNWAAGKGQGVITMEEIQTNLAKCVGRVEQVLRVLATSRVGRA
ncbi:MAG: S-methyl-5'-thioinosine phosphorylase [Thiocapsa sp.]|jgi:5'-methylthioadenosine phosphorylase/5'-methylthioinosine phosphorylase|nr:S-methyl-5'-thioinosine phosphorylase [Thiocapsa sp.]MCG6896581.1 S-methyl-5'-thioinosine phosphorylase [Thiocapsa sp.]MCG6985701.1 S-methyl-5'-thioinosine phosphorylase [Thiocapsa sp.]